MTTKEYESLTCGIALNAIRFDRGEMDKKTFMKNLKIILGKDVFEKTIAIMDEDDE
ncbi:MAG: hypothetical protein FWF82_00810 [Oscillospiraceae bacterium]|jgi:hypothetical protein|nr:hypothetical protein [Oscillospiraceae bacterium]